MFLTSIFVLNVHIFVIYDMFALVHIMWICTSVLFRCLFQLQIRLESKGGKNSSIMFCTNGVLLRLLIGRVTNISKEQNQKRSFDDAVTGITHIIVVMFNLRTFK